MSDQFHDPSSIASLIDFDAITKLFRFAEEEGRYWLFEYETYSLLKYSGAETPPDAYFLPKGVRQPDEVLQIMPGEQVVLKIVSPSIVHKTEVGGVRVINKTPEKIRSTIRRMMYEVPENFALRIERDPDHAFEDYRGLDGDLLRKAIARDIRGVLMVQYMPPDSQAFGNEMIVGIRNTREFGMVISAGLGGTDTELYAKRFRKGHAVVVAATGMSTGDTFFDLFRRTISYQKLAGLTRGGKRIVTDEQLIECFSTFIEMANYYSLNNPKAPFAIEELEINPFAFTDFLMVPLDGLCRFSRPGQIPIPRPFWKIDRLLHPETIGIIGVSLSRVNFGRIILNNILSMGFDRKNLRIIQPKAETFESIVCVPELAALDIKLDLLVVAVVSEQLPGIVNDILKQKTVETVMLIPGGMGETRESQQRAAQLMDKISQAHLDADGGPVFLGANCLGVVSHPGRFDTLFIPEAKLPKRRGEHTRNAAFISQSGAFMITRLSKREALDPAYMVSVGNQNDLTLGDMLHYFKNHPDIRIIAIYAEGFKDLDGLALSKGVREAVLAGKDVIFYKAGRTHEGKTATSSHTASLAGDYTVCESCIRQSGGIVAATFTQFEDLMMLAQRFNNSSINGNRLAALSGAGFEAVGMADNIQSDDFAMTMASIGQKTLEKIKGMLLLKSLDTLVEPRNPLDISPAADDEAHILAVRYLAEDPAVDAVVVGLDPLSPAMRTLATCETHQYSFDEPGSIALELPKLVASLHKPVIGVVDGGSLFDPLVNELMDRQMVIFRSSDRAVRALAMYIEGRLYAEGLRRRAVV